MNKIELPAKIDRGKLNLNREHFSNALRGLPDGQYWIVLKEHKRDRSDPQNRYYWGCVIALISEWTGYTPEEAHEAMKMKFLRAHEDTDIPTVKSTTKLSTAEFEAYCESIRRFAAEHQVVIPEPNQTDWTE